MHLRVGHIQPQRAESGNQLINELLAKLIVGAGLDAPAHQLRRVGRFAVTGAEHHQRRPPPAVDSVLRHLALHRRTLGIANDHLLPLLLVKAFLGTDAHHGPRVGAIGAVGQHRLIDDGCAVDQPADGAHVGPAKRGVVEDAGILGAAVVQGVDHLVAGDAQGLGRMIEVLAVAALVLHLGQQNHLASQIGGAGDPCAFGQHAHHFAVGMLGDHADELLAIGVGHPVARFDLLAAGDARLKRRQFHIIFLLVHRPALR